MNVNNNRSFAKKLMKDHFNKIKNFSVKRETLVRGEERLFEQRKREMSIRLRIKDEVVVIDL